MKRRSFMELGVKSGLAASLINLTGCKIPTQTNKSDSLGKLLPTRELGKTGTQLTMFGVGGAHCARMDDTTAQKHFEFALEQGVRFFDTAYIYYKGRSERLIGKYLTPKYRDNIFIMTKAWSKDVKKTDHQFMESLKRMNTDYVDLLMIHSIENVKDVETRHKNGVFDKFQEYKEKGLVKNIGYSCHSYTSAAKRLLELTKDHDFISACMTTINPVDAANKNNSFTRDILPESIKRGHSHFAMKTMAGGGLVGLKATPAPQAPAKFPIPEAISIDECMLFALSLPITAWVSGTNNIDQLKHNIDLVKSSTRLSESDRQEIVNKVASYWDEPYIEWYKDLHKDLK